jgi:hypothetical protein
MNKDVMILGAGVGLMLLTGCAATNSRYSSTDVPMATSTLASAPVTTPEELVKWTQYFPNHRSGGFFRSTETYTFVVPASSDVPASELPTFSESLPTGSVFAEAAGGETKTYRVIRHTPNQR